MKKIVVDSSSLITISGNCFIKILKHISMEKELEFIIPESVYRESVEKPLSIKRFELNAVRIRDAVEENYLKIAKTTPQTRKLMEEFMEISASVFRAGNRKIRLIDPGEAETLALMKETGANILLIDERTTRMLIEEPENVPKFLERRHHSKVEFSTKALGPHKKFFSGLHAIRSVELLAYAYETGAFQKELHASKQALEAALYAAKFAGCAVTFEEIKEFLKSVRN